MFANARPSEQVAVLERLSPVSQAAATVTTGWIKADKFHEFMAVITTGVLGASATVDAKFQQANTSGGGGAKDVTSKAITQLVKASNDNNEVVMNLRTQELDVEGGFAWFRLSLTVGTAASLVSAVVMGLVPRFAPASDSNKATVVQTLA